MVRKFIILDIYQTQPPWSCLGCGVAIAGIVFWLVRNEDAPNRRKRLMRKQTSHNIVDSWQPRAVAQL